MLSELVKLKSLIQFVLQVCKQQEKNQDKPGSQPVVYRSKF